MSSGPALSALLLVLALVGPSAAGTLDDTTWSLSGTSTARIGKMTQTGSLTGTLTLQADRTFTLTEAGSTGPGESGAWFVNGTRAYLFPQNLLAQITALESLLTTSLGEPVRVSLLRFSELAGLNVRANTLAYQEQADFSVLLVDSGLTLPLSIRTVATGTPAP